MHLSAWLYFDAADAPEVVVNEGRVVVRVPFSGSAVQFDSVRTCRAWLDSVNQQLDEKGWT